jgi:hypothetical protein
MMHEVTDYVLDEALRRVAEWRRQGSTATGLGERLGERPAGPGAAGARGPPAWRCGACRAPRSSWSSPRRRSCPTRSAARRSCASCAACTSACRSTTTAPVRLAGYLRRARRRAQVVQVRSCSAWRQPGRPVRPVRSTLELAALARTAGRPEGVEDGECAALLATWGSRRRVATYGRTVPAQEVVLDLTASDSDGGSPTSCGHDGLPARPPSVRGSTAAWWVAAVAFVALVASAASGRRRGAAPAAAGGVRLVDGHRSRWPSASTSCCSGSPRRSPRRSWSSSACAASSPRRWWSSRPAAA